MKLSSKNRIITTALAGILALGVAGCSFSAETKTTLSTEAGGEETTTTTETKADDSGVSTSTSTTSTSTGERYKNDHFNYIFTIPEGFEKKDVTSDSADEELELMVENSNGSNCAITVIYDITNKQGVTGLEMWANGFADSLKQNLESQGETITKIEPSLTTIGSSTNCGTVYSESTKDGKTIYRKAYLFLDNEGTGSILRITAYSEDDFKAMDNYVGTLEAKE